MDTIDLWDVIKEMRRLSSEGKTFSFSHGTWNSNTCHSDGMRKVENAYLRPQAKGEHDRYADMKLYYYDLDLRENRKCWQVLLMYFNGKKVVLS